MLRGGMQMSKYDVITMGSAVVDVFVDTTASEERGQLCFPIGDKILIKSLKFTSGGGGTNTAVSFSKLGLKVGFIGKLGSEISPSCFKFQFKNKRDPEKNITLTLHLFDLG